MKAVIVGDNLVTSEMFLSRCGPLRDAGYDIQVFEWLAPNRDELNQRNLNVERHGPEAEPPPEGLEGAVRDAEILLVHMSPVPAAVVEAGRELKAIGVARGGWENVNVGAATRCGVPVVHIVGRNANTVAEFTVGMMVSEMRNIARSDCVMRGGVWYSGFVDPHRCFELRGKTVGLVGFGAIARRLARLLRGFDVRMLAYDPFASEEAVRALGGEQTSLDALLSQSDVVSIHARLLPQTEGLIGERELAVMKPTAYLINTARAGLIDEAALLKALQERKIAGAAIDVFWQEPLPPESPWLQLDNLTMTSHLAGTTADSFYYSAELVIEAVLDCLHRSEAERVVNPEVLASG
jgi:D-3-phosphoglycerate dehydrogenase